MKKNDLMIIGLIALVLIVLASSSSLLPASLVNFNGIPMQIGAISAVNQSGSNISYVSNDADLSNTRFLVSASLGQGGSTSLTASYVDSQLPSSLANVNFSKQTSIVPVGLDEKAVYTISSVQDNIYRYNLTDILTGSCPVGTNYRIPKPLNTGTYCVTKSVIGTFGTLDYPPVYKANATFRLTNSGVSDIVTTVGNTNSGFPTNADFRSGSTYLGSVYWTSNDVGYAFPNPNALRTPYFLNGNSAWKLAYSTSVTNYKLESAKLDAVLSGLQQTGFNTGYTFGTFGLGFPIPSCFGDTCSNQLSTLLGNFNTLLYTPPTGIAISDLTIPTPNVTSTTTKTTLNGKTAYSVDFTNQAYIKPNIQFTLTSQAVGAFLSTGKPVILSNSSCSFDSGSTGSVSVVVLNQGSALGTFNGSASCGSVNLVNPNPLMLGAGQTGTMIFSASSSSVGSNQCSLTVQDASSASNKATTSFSCTVNTPQVCVAGSYRTVGNIIYKCQADGKGEDQTACANGILATNPPTCVPSNGGGATCNNNSVCESGENVTNCPSDCSSTNLVGACTDAQIQAGNHTVVSNTPQYFLIFQTGTTQTTTCVPNLDVNLILGIIIVVAGGLIGFTILTKKGGK